MGQSAEARGRSKTRNQKTHPSTTIDKCELLWPGSQVIRRKRDEPHFILLFFLYVLFQLPLFAVHLSTFFLFRLIFLFSILSHPSSYSSFSFPSISPPPEIFFLCLSMTACARTTFFFSSSGSRFLSPTKNTLLFVSLFVIHPYPSQSGDISHSSFPSTPCLDRRYAIWDTFLGSHTHTYPFFLCLFDIYYFSISLSARRFSTAILSLCTCPFTPSSHHSPAIASGTI
ncbi:MAG: hypothetical protein JOS17DRAFT_187609 [Linnemannia elongata]|nr:MAG: hypothetical protein JOS17DRAFT_187609 [Linnemannia elongata]